MTAEERGNYAVPVAVNDLDPADYPKIPSVRDIAIPPQVKMTRLGEVHQVLHDPIPLVVVAADAESPTLADESMVFDGERKPVGLIFETFGTVKKPFYSIRFNTVDELKQINLKQGAQINFGEGFSEFVNVRQLLAQKGSDASWEHDVEVDTQHQVSNLKRAKKVNSEPLRSFRMTKRRNKQRNRGATSTRRRTQRRSASVWSGKG